MAIDLENRIVTSDYCWSGKSISAQYRSYRGEYGLYRSQAPTEIELDLDTLLGRMDMWTDEGDISTSCLVLLDLQSTQDQNRRPYADILMHPDFRIKLSPYVGVRDLGDGNKPFPKLRFSQSKGTLKFYLEPCQDRDLFPSLGAIINIIPTNGFGNIIARYDDSTMLLKFLETVLESSKVYQ